MNPAREARAARILGSGVVLVTVISVLLVLVSGGMGVPSLAQMGGDLKCWFAMSWPLWL